MFSPALTPGWAKAFLALHRNSVSTSTQSPLLLPFHRCQTRTVVWSLRLSFLLPLPFDFHEHFPSTWPLNLAVLCPVGFWFPKDPIVTRLPSPPRVKHQCTLYSIPITLLIFINGSPRVILFFFPQEIFVFSSSPHRLEYKLLRDLTLFTSIPICLEKCLGCTKSSINIWWVKKQMHFGEAPARKKKTWITAKIIQCLLSDI